MPRYWVIAPVANNESYDKVWEHDLSNQMVSIGFSAPGDVSKLSKDDLLKAVRVAYPDKPAPTSSLVANMLWAFYHEIAPGDFIIARRGIKILAAVGKVLEAAIYGPQKTPFVSHHGVLKVEWFSEPRDKAFSTAVFNMQTLSEIGEAKYLGLIGKLPVAIIPTEPALEAVDQYAFVLEKYLEDFIVSNFKSVFKGKLEIYTDGERDGQQYNTTDIGLIDILAVEPETNCFVVIELKKGRPSDQVIGQVLRYMGWVKKNLCNEGQSVKGLVICRDLDPKLSYAVDMTNNVEVRYYNVSFNLGENPQAAPKS